MATYLGFEPKETEPYYFVSYDTGDKETVAQYVCEMNRLGLPLWYDHGIHTGDRWEQVIADHIIGCQAVILFFSSNIFKKEDSYVRKEFNLAKRYKKQIFVLLLDSFNDQDVPAKYAFWWDSVKDLQCVFVGDFDTLGNCVTKVMADLAEAPTPSLETETPTFAHTTAEPEDSFAMLRRRILAAILPLKGSVTTSMLEEKVGYPLSNPDATMLLKDMVEKGEICNCGYLYWSPNIDLRGQTKDYIGRIIGRANDYVTAKQLVAEHQNSVIIANELPAMLDTLLKEGTIIRTANGYCSADYPSRVAAAKAFFTDALKAAGGSLPKSSFFALTYDGIFARDNVRILEDMCAKEQVIRHGDLCCLPSFDLAAYVLEKIKSQLEAARHFIPIAKLTVREELDLREEEFIAVLHTLCAQGAIACRGAVCFFPSFDVDAYIEREVTSQLRTNYTPLPPFAFSVREALGLSVEEFRAVLDGLCDRGQLRKIDGKYCSGGFLNDRQTASDDLLDFIKVNDERLFTKYELATETKHEVRLIDAVLPSLIRDGHLKNTGYYYYAPSRDLMTLLCRHVTREIEKAGYLPESTVDEYILNSGCRMSDEEGKKALEAVVRECHLFLVPCGRTMNWYYSRPKYYGWLCEQKASAKTAKAFRDLKEKFAALGDFKDCAALAEECGRQAEIFKEKEKAKKLERQKAQEAQEKKNARRRFWRKLFPSFSRKK